MMRAALISLFLAASTAAFRAPVSRSVSLSTTQRVPPVSAFGRKPEAKPEAPPPMSAWDKYTEGEYGQAFKFPWETEASDKTAPRLRPREGRRCV